MTLRSHINNIYKLFAKLLLLTTQVQEQESLLIDYNDHHSFATWIKMNERLKVFWMQKLHHFLLQTQLHLEMY